MAFEYKSLHGLDEKRHQLNVSGLSLPRTMQFVGLQARPFALLPKIALAESSGVSLVASTPTLCSFAAS